MPPFPEVAIAQFAEPLSRLRRRHGRARAGFALAEVGVGAPTQIGIVEPVEHEQGALDPLDLVQRAGDRILARIAGKLAQHNQRPDGVSPDGGGEPQRLVPVLINGADVAGPGDEPAERRLGCEVAHGVETPFAKIPDARCEPKAEQVAKAEDVIDDAGGIGRMFADRDSAFMVEQPFDDVRSVADIGGADLGVEGREVIGDTGVEQHARLAAVAGVVVGAWSR